MPLIFVVSMALAGAFTPMVDENKFTVCAITINSDEEKKVFASQMANYPQKFNPIVELTDLGDENNWFKKACESGIRCDQLVISGHFGGTFFGDGNKTLSLKELEAAGCSKTCENILAKPYEVFLFGCNTLATKDADHRTPAQYLQVLLKDGIPLAQAELIVESRYGAIGDSNKSAMQRSFGGENKQLYGFDSVGPSGKNVKGFMEDYFAKISAPNRLEKLQAKRMMNDVNLANAELATSLKNTAFTQCEAGAIDDPVTKSICNLQDSKRSINENLALILELLTQDNYLVYMPAINNFFNAHSTSSFTPTQKKDLEVITNNEIIRKQIMGLVEKTTTLGLKSEWSQFAATVGFITEKERADLIQSEIAKFFNRPLTISQKDALCSLGWDIVGSLDLKLSDLKNKNFGPLEAEALKCLRVTDIDTFNQMQKRFLLEKNPKKVWAYISFMSYSGSEGNKFTQDTIQKLRTYLKSTNSKLVKYTVNLFVENLPTDPELNSTLQRLLVSPNVEAKINALNAYRLLNSQDKNVHQQILQILKTTKDDGLFVTCVWAFQELKVTDPAVLAALRQIAASPRLSEADKNQLNTYLNSVK